MDTIRNRNLGARILLVGEYILYKNIQKVQCVLIQKIYFVA